MNRFGLLLVGGAALTTAGAAGFSLAQDAAPANRTGVSEPSPPAAAPALPTTGAAGQPPVSAGPPDEESAAPTPAETAADQTVQDDTQDQGPPPPPAKPPEPLKRPRFTSAVLQALDKVTAKTMRFEVKVNEPVRYGDLVLTVHACEGTAPDEDFPDSTAHLEVVSQPPALPGQSAAQARQVFRGWMFASSPGLHPFQSPGYDVWLIACKTAAPAEPASPAPGAAAASL